MGILKKKAKGSDINESHGVRGLAALHVAAFLGFEDVCEWLLERRAVVDVRNVTGVLFVLFFLIFR